MGTVNDAPSLVGRDDALATLREALARAVAQHGQMVVVTGEPGIGKSALVDQLGREASAMGAQVLFGRAWELAEAPPYFPVWSGLRALGLAPPARGTAAEADAFRLWEEVLQALVRAAASNPVVWILEDLHAADHLTLDLLTFLARPLRALSVLLLITTRDRDPRIGDRTAARLARLCRDGRELRLGVLGAPEIRALAESTAGRGLPPAAVQQLAEVTGGNPLFVIECARGWRAAGPVVVPATVRELTLDRLALLGGSGREAVTCGAIVGRDFSAAVVARMLDTLPAAVIERVEPALRAGMLRELRPGQYRFSHILVRDAIEDALGTARAAELHDRAARALDGDGVDVLVERARHALQALRPDGDAVALALRAARELVALGASDRALALYQRLEDAQVAGLADARPTPDEALHRAAVARAAGRYGDAQRRCQALLAEARAAGDGALMARAALEMGAELRPGTVDPALVAALQEALSHLDQEERALRCRLEARLAGALQPADDPAGPVAMARAAIAAARALGEADVLLEVLHTAGAALVDYAPLEERLPLGAEMLERAIALDDGPRALQAHARLAIDHTEAGDFAAFDADLGQMRALSLRLSHPRRRWRPLLLESMQAISRGDSEHSDRCLVEIEEHAALSDDPALALALIAHRFHRAVLFHRDQEIRTALAELDRMSGQVPQRDVILGSIRMAALARIEDAAGAAQALTRLRGRLLIGSGEINYMSVDAFALVGSNDERHRLHAVLRAWPARHMAAGHIPFTYEGPVSRALGVLEASLGDPTGALAWLDEALAGARRWGHQLWVAQIGYDRGRILAGAGRTAEAAVALGEAATLAESLGMPGLVARARARLTAPTLPVPATGPIVDACAAGIAVIREDGDVWRIEGGVRPVRVRNSRGLELLARLVERPGEELHVLALSSDTGGALVEGDAGEALDHQARRTYRARLAELDSALDEAEAHADLGRKARLQSERAALEAELARSVGLGGKGRPTASATERARVNAQRRLKDALTRIAEADAALGARLARAVHTGTYCCFRP